MVPACIGAIINGGWLYLGLGEAHGQYPRQGSLTGDKPVEIVSTPVGEDTKVGDSGPIPINDDGGSLTFSWKLVEAVSINAAPSHPRPPG